ncbi:hypothetical protein [Streptomyces longisporoflavus]|uniref:Uncharacterized protein n=1 Tax=Streptomyces longisporoflavus TaxID=28044 RepID=A0ABW7QTB2_9ACTN
MSSSAISALWDSEQLPIRDGLYLASGVSYAVRGGSTPSEGLEILDEFDLEAVMREDPDWVTSFDITREVELPGPGGYLCCGEGSYGSEGFFARIDQDRRLVWVVYLEESNPFTGVEVEGSRAVFTSSSGVRISVDVNRPQSG